MPYEGTLYEFLSEVGLQQYHQDFVSKLGVTAIDHLAYVQADDVFSLGMTLPEWRRLRASMKKVKKGKFKPGKNGKASKTKPTIVRVPSQPGTPTGGHIIPASAINILDRELGRGEFGKVMQGIWTDKDGQKIQVAVKCLSSERFSADKAQDFVKEAAIMYSLNHESLVKLFGVVLDVETSLMLVTEFAALRSLLENIKQPTLRASFPITLLLEFAAQIVDAMRYLHLSNIIHRDLATRNILLFVDDDGTKKVKISDFGLSRRLILGENYRSEMKPNLKLPLAWMPVEALTKLTFTKASDVWSFGVTMWEMFTYGRQPWATHTGEEILKAIDKPALQRLERPEACPVKIYEILQKCWKHEPEKRPSFVEICEELPKAKPEQVKAITHYKPTKDGELAYRAEDIITVLESNEHSGIWSGILSSGKIGTFLRCNTTLMGSSSTSATGGSRLRRWKSGFRSDKRDARKSRLTTDAIGTPMGARHIFHVGPDGTVQGDATFGGDYRTLPADNKVRQPWSSSSSVSSASSASTRSPPRSPYRPNPPPMAAGSSATLPPSKSVPSLPPHSSLLKAKTNGEMTNSTPELATAGAPLHADQDDLDMDLTEPPVVFPEEREVFVSHAPAVTSRIVEEPTISPLTETPVEAAAAAPFTANGGGRTPSPDTFSLSLNLEMGSLLDEFMCEWDDRRNTVEVQDGKMTQRAPTEDKNKNWELGATNSNGGSVSSSSTTGNTPRPGSLHLSSSSGPSEGAKMSRGGVAAILRSSSKKKAAAGSATGAQGAGEENVSPLHNMIIKDSPSNPSKTYRRVPASTGSPPTASAAAGATGEQSDSPDDSCRRSEGSEVRLRVNLNRTNSLQDKKDEMNFVRLSTSPPSIAENDYIDTSSLVKSNPNSPAVEGLPSHPPFVTSMSTSSSSSSERTSSPLSMNLSQKVSSGDFSSPNEYEELSDATSAAPEDVVHPMPTKSDFVVRDLPNREVGRSKSMRVPMSHPAVEDLHAKRRGQFGRSRSLKETAASARAEEVYAKLIGGRISGSPTLPPRGTPSPLVSSSPRVVGSAGKSKNPFLDTSASPTASPSRRQRSVLERMSSVESSDGSKDGWRNSTSDRDSRELQFGPGDPLDEGAEVLRNKTEVTVGVKALRSRFDAPSPPPRQTPPSASPKKPPPPKVPPRGPRSQKTPQSSVVKTTANIVLCSPTGITHSPKGLNNNYSPEGDNVFGSPEGQSTADVKLSPRMLQSLEKNMPRRVRRSIGEARIKRRGSSDVSDSDNEPSFVKHQSGDFSSRTVEGDSSSDETAGKFVGRESSIGFGVTSANPLPDLPEDQTNRNKAKLPHPLSLPPRVPSSHPQTRHSMPARSSGIPTDRATSWASNEVERVDLADFAMTPPQSPTRAPYADSDSDEEQDERYAPPPSRRSITGALKSGTQSGRNPMTRGHTVDVPIVPHRHSTNPFVTSQENTRPPLLTSQSLDGGRGRADGMEDFVRASPEDFRRLIRQESASKTLPSQNEEASDDDDSKDYVFCKFENDDLSDMPSRLPPAPPVPVSQHKLSTPQSSLDVKIPAYQGDINSTPPSKPKELIREVEYEIMNPQRNSAFFSEVEQVSQSMPASQKTIPLTERELPPLPPLPGTQVSPLIRSRSAHSFSVSNKIPSSEQLRGRRGTLASASRSETLKEIDDRQGTRSLDRLQRKSRSSEGLPEDESGLKEAESLTDVLARTYNSPPVPVGSSNYIHPPPKNNTLQQRVQPPMVHPQRPKEPPPPAAVNNYHMPRPLPHRPSEDYIDMSHKRPSLSKPAGAGPQKEQDMMPPDGGPQKALDVQAVRKALPDEITVDECTQVLRGNLWNVALTIKILKIRYLTRTLLLDDGTCRQALEECNWDLGMATAIIGQADESSISL
ncbi:nascent polypeptide-associated complex subunit alpha, muscle-specific form-like isoform X2 [Patiria miniata]|uniref:non-specific protein-tyrosine kinase n=1 Tax=Patiria miniata TaxID=46514 RepID=A0A914BTV8_PATMI|nr:nascent polypeptide-associated complex subunit alpha, muscle-specific form-like isoform X2 [Patiria miniata]